VSISPISASSWFVSALFLALFFPLGIEQKVARNGTLPRRPFLGGEIRRLFVAEGFATLVAGTIVGSVGAIAYAAFLALRPKNLVARCCGNRLLTLHISEIAVGSIAAS